MKYNQIFVGFMLIQMNLFNLNMYTLVFFPTTSSFLLHFLFKHWYLLKVTLGWDFFKILINFIWFIWFLFVFVLVI